MKVAVYAIAKNEERFVDRFMDSLREADYVCVLDTGSTDGTVERLRMRGAMVEREVFEPFRFDAARNRSMELIPADADVGLCLDLDEVLRPGWREKLEDAWKPGTDLGAYLCVCSRNADGSEGTAFLRRKLHRPGAYRWKYPVHEVLEYCGDGSWGGYVEIPELAADHLPDEGKSRAQYLPLLELAVREDPEDARCAHYLGREYMYRGMWDRAIEELERHLALPKATWNEERCASMRYLSACHISKGAFEDAVCWAMRAAAEAPWLRESWYCAQRAAYFRQDWYGVVSFGLQATKIRERSSTAINEADAWGAGPWDLLSIGYWYTGHPSAAIRAAREALRLEPENQRIRGNYQFYSKERGYNGMA